MRELRSPPDWQRVLRDRAEALSTLDTGPYAAFVLECQSKYRHWEKVRFLARSRGLDAELAWAHIALRRFGTRKELPMRGAGRTHLQFATPDLVQRQVMQIDQRLAGRIDFGGSRPLTEGERQRFIFTSLHEEAITSSMLEGAATTRREAQEMLQTGRPPRNRGERMVLNNFRAIEFIRRHRRTPLTPEFICELQSLLTRDTLDPPTDVGRIRESDDNIRVVDNRTGDTIHLPPPAAELPDRLRQLCAFANEDALTGEPFVHPVIRAIALHFQLAFDHPFCDGNGRTARALFYWSMLRQGYWMFEYLPISRFIYRGPARYVTAFLYTETDAFDLTYFLVYNLRLIAEASRELEDHVRSEREEAARRAAGQRPPGINDRQWAQIQRMRVDSGTPITVEKYRDSAGASYGTARHDLLDLAARGVLSKVKRGRQFQFFLR